MPLSARAYLPALLLSLLALAALLTPPAGAQTAGTAAYDTPALAAAAQRLEQDIRARVLKRNERPQPFLAQQATDAGLALVRERRYPEAIPQLERAIAHGGGTFAVWIAYSNAQGAQRAANHRRALEAAYIAWKKAGDAKARALSLYFLGYWFELMREGDAGIAAYEDSLKIENNPTVRNRLNQMVMQYRHQVVETKADVESAQPRICLTFSKPLPDKDPSQYARFIAIEPQVQAAFDAKERTLCISGVAFSQSYRITVRQGLPSTGQWSVPRTETYTIAVPDRAVTLAFRSQAYILPKASRQGIPLSTVNVERAEIRVLRINDRNLINEIVGERIREMLYEHTAKRIQENQGELVWSGTMRVNGERNKEATTAIPFGEAVKEPKPGIYVVLARSAPKTKAGDGEDDDTDHSEWATQWVVVTDIGVSTYSSPEGGLAVFARSYETAAARAGVQVRLMARNNEVLGTATTDANGRADFPAGLLRGEGGNRAAALLMSTAEGEFAFIDIVRTAFDLTDRGVGGRETPAGADGFVYTERGVYRPGETVHATALLRDNNGSAVGDMPVVVRLMRPDGVEAQRFTLRTAGAGSYTVSIALPKSAATGAWRLLAHLDPKGQPVGSASFKVEDFVPERLEMTLAATPKILAEGQPVKIAVTGRFLYGAPAADLAVDGEATIRLDAQPFSQYRDFFFGTMQERFDPVRKEIESARTDAKGETALEISLDEKIDSTRPLVADVRVTLNEEGGRAIERRVSVPLSHRAAYYGLKLDNAEGVVAENQAAKFLAVAVDRDGNRKSAALKYALVREVFEYQWYNQDGRWNYRGVLRSEPVQNGEIALGTDAPAALSFTTPNGRYRLELLDESGAVASYRYSVGWVYSGDNEDVPDKLQVRLDKASYKAGETAQVSVRPPFAGTVHIVVASDRVLASRIETVPAEGKVFDIAVDESWGTGVYVIATAYRPNGKAERLGPSRAIGVAYLARDTAERVLSVKLTAPETMTPRRKLDVKVAVDGARGEPVYLTLAAVDEGVLALTSYKTPAPDSYFYGKRKLALELRDDYGRLIDAYAGRLGEIRQGGDASSRHLGGLDVSTIQVVSLYSGIVRADEKGEATVSLDVPDFNGRLRLMAVAWTANKLGKGEQNVTVHDPVVSTVTLPRFLTPDDQGRVTVVIHNVDGPAGAYRVRLTAAGEGAAMVAAPAEATVEIAKDQRQRLAFTLVGVRPGTAAIRLSIDGPQSFSLARNWDIAVRPAQANVAKFLVSQIGKGESFNLAARDLGEFLPGTAQLYLTVGTTPDLGIADLIASLDRYPYGCAEQTTSRALPLLYMAEMAQAVGVAKDEPALRDRVQQAIYRVLTMQQRDGGFGMWSAFDQGGGWLTAFIMDFLTQARAKGYVVPDIAFEQGLKRLDRLARDLAYEGPALPVLAYAHYVLAANKQGDVAAVRYLHDTQLPEMPTALAKAQLAAALALFGDTARAKTAFEAARTHTTRPGAEDRYYRPLVQDYGSLLRDRAGVLALASTAQPQGTGAQGTGVEELLAAVRADRAQKTQLSTQEQTWLLLAAHGLGTPTAQWKARINGLAQESPGRPFAARYDAAALGQRFGVTNDGEAKLWVGATLTGIPAADQPPAKNGFEITRAFYTLKGQRVDLAKVRQSDVLVAVIKVSAQGTRPHQAMVVDLLPASFEIENPRLDRRDPEQMKWLPELAQPRAVEPRDDRYVAALDIWSNKRDYYLAYVVRAVTPGTFRLPAAYVENMYAPAVMGRDALSKVTVLPRQ